MQISQKQDKKTEQILCLVSIFLHPNSKLYDGKSHRLYWSMRTIKFELQLFDIKIVFAFSNQIASLTSQLYLAELSKCMV